jgi:ATP-dependent RNA helicase RhlE
MLKAIFMNNYSNRNSSGSKSSTTSNRPNKSFRKGPRQAQKGRKPSTLDPNLLIKKSKEETEVKFESKRTISDLPISSVLKESLLKKGFERPTEIQDRTIETLMEGTDLLGLAQTGTGKTGAFAIPIIEQLIQHKRTSFALIVVPTRELAIQVEEEFRSMTKNLNLYSACFIGGTNINKDIANLRRSSHVIIGTPGRLLDLVQRKVLNLREFNTLVLDEFDRMLDMGFIHDMKRIISGMHQRKHTMLFSATMDNSQESLIAEILNNPVRVKVSNGSSSGDYIEQDIIRLNAGQDKFQVLQEMVSSEDFQKVLVFEETKHKVKRLCEKLIKSGVQSDQIHGNKSQNARQKALNSFKQGSIKVLVATDVAARGIDVSDVTHVINYQLPMDYDSYIHRIGRTGRAGKRGKAFTFVN